MTLADADTDGSERAQDDPTPSHWGLRIAITAIGVSVVGLIAVAVASPLGFDFGDEGWALTATRSPADFLHQANPTRFQYLTGDLYRLLGENLVLLRLSRLLIITVATALLAVAVFRMLHHLGITTTRTDRLFAVAIVGVSSYGANWFPLSPSYNDVMLVMHLLFAAAIIAAAVSLAPRIRVSGLLYGVAAGALSWFALMTKFSGTLALVVMAVAVPLAAGWGFRRSLDRWLALVGSGVVGVAIGALVWQIHYAPVGTTVSAILHSVKTSQEGSVHSTSNLLGKGGLELVVVAGFVTMAWWATRATTSRSRLIRYGLLAAGVVVSPVVLQVLLGGSFKINVASALGIIVIVAAVAAAAPGPLRTPKGTSDGTQATDAARAQRRGVLLLFGALASTPFIGAIGTAASITAVAAHECAFGLLAGLVLLIGTRSREQLSAAIAIGLSVAILALAGVALVWRFPLNQPALTQATAQVDRRSPLHDLRVDPARARSISQSLTAMSPDPSRAVLPFFSLEGFVFATDSTSPGQIFEDTERVPTQEVISRACRQRKPIYVVTDLRQLPSWVAADLKTACRIDDLSQLHTVATVPRVNQSGGSRYRDDMVIERVGR